jgi:hypothetical protein
MTLFTTAYKLSDEGDVQIYKMSLYLIPFFSLMLITPNIPLMKRVLVSGIGISIFLSLDIVLVQFIIHVDGESNLSDNSVDVLLQSLKLLLSPLLWIILTSPFLNSSAGRVKRFS